MLPDFLVIGAPKAATTWLADCLREHPDVYIPEVKELRWFCGTHRDKGLDWYRAHFADTGGAIAVGEASPSYLGSPEAPGRIRALLPEVRLILSLRHPVEQAWSFYWHLMSRGCLAAGTEFPRFFAEQRPRAGHYGHHVARWLEHFEREQLLILLYDRDVRADPAAGLARVQRFIGVDSSHRPAALLTRRNVGGDLRALSGVAGLVHRGLDLLPIDLRRRVKRAGRAVQQALPTRRSYRPLDPALRDGLLREHCQSDLRRLQDLTQIDLSPWYGAGGETA